MRFAKNYIIKDVKLINNEIIYLWPVKKKKTHRSSRRANRLRAAAVHIGKSKSTERLTNTLMVLVFSLVFFERVNI